MVGLLGGSAVVAALLVAGLVLAVSRSLSSPPRAGRALAAAEPRPSGASPDVPPAAGAGARDALAAAPLPSVDAQAAHPGVLSTRDPGAALVLPPATGLGPAGVPTGFPRTPEGALAQLAALDQVAFQSGSVAGVRAVLAGWALPGGPTASSWSAVAGMEVLLEHAGLSGGGSPQLGVRLTPLMGLLKGVVGEEFVVPCVDFELDVTLAQTARGAVADCQRMTWSHGRWMIAAGSEPAAAPSVWPDTDAALAAGYRDLRRG